MLSREEFLRLLEKFTSGNINYEEHTTLFECIRSNNYDDLLAEDMQTKFDKSLGMGEGIPPYRSQEIIRKIISTQEQMAVLMPVKSIRTKIIRWSAAAVLLGLLAFLSYFYILNEEFTPPTAHKSKSVSKLFEADRIQKENETSDPLTMEMEDGSIIVLRPGAILKYPRHFSSDKREVYLEGEAFFQITKNVKRPFFVYNKKLVTHVIGTSFTIKTDDENKQVEVAVRTGKVEVYEKGIQESGKKKNNGVILLPNQKVVYHEGNGQFVASLVDVPLPVANNNSPEKIEDIYQYESTVPLSEVLQSLENTYGIEMIVENENLNKCLFTGDISKQNLYTKLDIICKTLNASYELVGTKIIIRGKGCEE
jgi:transmembrane sensor